LELVTDRLSRYIEQAADDWKKQHANWVCKTLLDYFDPHDRHCVTPSQTIPATSLPQTFFDTTQAEIKATLQP
jgi:hypothetical protein